MSPGLWPFLTGAFSRLSSLSFFARLYVNRLHDFNTLGHGFTGSCLHTQAFLGFESWFVPWCILIMVVFNVLFVGIVMFAYWKFNFSKR